MNEWKLIFIMTVAIFTAASARPSELPAGNEIIELRDAFSRHYLNEDGTITARISSRPVHVKDESGAWVASGEITLEQTAETFEYTFATGHCAYNGSEYGKTDMGLIKVEREIILYPPSFVDRVGWMKFDISSIPDSATITWARCRFIVTYFEMSMGLAFTCLTSDPLPTGAETLYNAINNSEVCAMGDMPRAVSSFELGPIAAAHIQQALYQNWVAFGQVGYNYSGIVTKRGWIIGWNVDPREHAPQLDITYEPLYPTPEPTSPAHTPTHGSLPTFTPTLTPTPQPSCTPSPSAVPTELISVPALNIPGFLLLLTILSIFIGSNSFFNRF